VSRPQAFDIAVLGGGPAGLVAALSAAKSARTALILNRPPDPGGPLRIDAIPARTLALLVELGIEPRVIGVERLLDGQGVCWESDIPTWSRRARTGHIERPLLECALFNVLHAENHVKIIIDRTRPSFDGIFHGASWRAKKLVDATGRASVTSKNRVRLQPAWASRFYWTSRDAVPAATPEFRIAVLSSGYAYRLGSARRIGIGFVGREEILNSDPARILEDAAWLREDMPSFSSMERGASGVTSVQWATPGHAALAGDASIARDSLSSQGLAASLSDAMYAVAAIMSDRLDSLQARQAENLSAHLTHLKEQLMRCRYHDSPLWSAYERFISETNTNVVEGQVAPAIRYGRLEAHLPSS
jgi:2-polyprenyl-6-methoxyphenol hydroxylase-like FAD-dependent oxidoreductase